MKYKPKIYNFSQDKFLDKVADQSIVDKFDIVENTGLLATEVLVNDFDVIEIAPNDFEEFRSHILAVDWKTNQLGMADCLIKQSKSYKSLNLLSSTIIDLIKKSNKKINSQLPVIVVGDYHFVYGMAIQLALSGFVEIIVSITENDQVYADLIANKIRGFIFNLNIRFVNVNELTTSDIVGALLISNFKKSLNKDAYDLLTYFNFLSQGAIFIDCNSLTDSSLVEDARKAEIAVIDEGEVISHKYNFLLEILKISP